MTNRSSRPGIRYSLPCVPRSPAYVQHQGATAASASQIGAGAIIILALTPFMGTGPLTLTPAITGSVLILGGIGTGIAYIWYTNVINAWGATIASTVTYLTPIGGVLLGVLFLGETIPWNQIMGGTIVIFGILVGQGRLRLPRSLKRNSDDESSVRVEIVVPNSGPQAAERSSGG